MQTESVRQTKDYRIATRVTGAHKSLFEHAAELKGLSLSDFMVSAAYEAAVKTLQTTETVLHLSPADSRAFLEALTRPLGDPKIETPNLYKAFADYHNAG